MAITPQSLNLVLLYGRVALVRQIVTPEVAQVILRLSTSDGDPGHAILLAGRRALEALAFEHAHRELYPDEPLTATVQGHLISGEGGSQVAGDNITFHLLPAVRKSGGRLAYRLCAEAARQYERCTWLEGGHA